MSSLTDKPLPEAPALLQAHIDRAQLKKCVLDVMNSDIPSLAALRMDLSLIQHLLAILHVKMPSAPEELVTSILIEILQGAWGIDDREQELVRRQIGFLIANGLAVVKKPGFLKRVRKFFRLGAKKSTGKR
jgi:hypothetical protein